MASMCKNHTKYLVVTKVCFTFASKLHKQWKEAMYISTRILQ